MDAEQNDRDAFEEWLMDMPDVLEDFVQALPAELELDYSPESLLRLETWILKRYRAVDELLSEQEKMTLDSLARYVGQVYRIQLHGTWDIQLDNPDEVYSGLPLVVFDHETAVSPISRVVASVDRRAGDYIYKFFMKKKNRMESA
ncbi:MAG: hypothetical protein WBV82_28495 [Myxococcaceae bacterium]